MSKIATANQALASFRWRLLRGTIPKTRNKIVRHQHPCRGHRGHYRRDSVSRFDFDYVLWKLTGAEGNFAMGRTVKQLIDSYRTDPDSNFPKLQYQVRMKNDGELTRLIEKHGSIQLRDIRFRTLTTWYRDWPSDGKIATAT